MSRPSDRYGASQTRSRLDRSLVGDQKLLGNGQAWTQHSSPVVRTGSSRWRSDPLHGNERGPTRRLGCMGVASVVQPADFVVLGNGNQQPDAGLPQARLRPRARIPQNLPAFGHV